MKISRGNEYNKNSLCKILINETYKGIYKYSDNLIPDGVPRIADDETFQAVQIQMAGTYSLQSNQVISSPPNRSAVSVVQP